MGCDGRLDASSEAMSDSRTSLPGSSPDRSPSATTGSNGAQPVTSPCTGDCELDDVARACTGCRRSLDEVVRWPHMTNDERRAIVARIERSVR